MMPSARTGLLTPGSEALPRPSRTPKALRALLLAVWLTASTLVLATAQGVGPRQEPSGFTLVETSRTPDGKTLYSLEAYGASLHDLLTALLRRTGSEFTVASDVSGQVSVVRRNATLEELLELLQNSARPGFVIQRGQAITVTGKAGSPWVAVPGVGGIRQVGPMAAAPASPTPSVSPLHRPITLHIDEKRPIPLSQALAIISRQTGAVFRLDNRIPRDLGFAAQVTNTPLQALLDSMAHSGALKWSIQPDGTLLVSPSDWLKLFVGQNVIAGSSARTCERCVRGLVPGWSYCPFCGQKAPVTSSRPGTRTP